MQRGKRMRSNLLRRSVTVGTILVAFSAAVADSQSSKPAAAPSPDFIHDRVMIELDIANQFYWLELAEDGNCRAFERGFACLDIAQHMLDQTKSPQLSNAQLKVWRTYFSSGAEIGSPFL